MRRHGRKSYRTKEKLYEETDTGKGTGEKSLIGKTERRQGRWLMEKKKDDREGFKERG